MVGGGVQLLHPRTLVGWLGTFAAAVNELPALNLKSRIESEIRLSDFFFFLSLAHFFFFCSPPLRTPNIHMQILHPLDTFPSLSSSSSSAQP